MLAFGTLRYDVHVQIFAVIVTLAAIVAASSVAPLRVAEGAPLASAERLLAVPPAIVRLTMLAMAGCVLVIAVRRSRDLLLRAKIWFQTTIFAPVGMSLMPAEIVVWNLFWVFAGTIGDEARLEFTVIGDTVNVAARLQEMTKEHATMLLATTAIVEAAGEAADARWIRLPSQPLRGRDAPVDLYALDAR